MKRLIIHITGVVQGVGFRPTVYRYARNENLKGYVSNTGKGVTIEVEGEESSLSRFREKLLKNPPAAARIDSFSADEIPVRTDEDDFTIRFSETSPMEKSAGISPDMATCPDCREEIFSGSNRRNAYPFTNCTNCGPRFTIIHDRPYDRPLTTMSGFEMCPACKEEYNDPADRRFHAQPNCCPQCGPSLELNRNNDKSPTDNDLIEQAAQYLKKGEIGAIKGLGGFHFACDPLNSSTLKRLRDSKDRPNKAFALMMKDLDEIKKYCLLAAPEEKALLSSAAPIVLLRKSNNLLDAVSPDNNYLGVMLPFTPLHHLLMEKVPLLIMTSANRRDEPLAINDDEVKAFSDSGMVDFYLTHNRPIAHRCDDSIIQFVQERMQFIRRSRGYVPNPVFISGSISDTVVLSLGANMKNTFSFRKGGEVTLSQHIGDLADYRNLEYQSDQTDDLGKLLDLPKDRVRIDAHPGYENYRDDAGKIYHHHAHMLSVMAEHNLEKQSCLGVICDGTGYGTDGTIWGFEFLRTDRGSRNFTREAHLDTFSLPGGEAAIREIDRIAIALGEGLDDLPFPPERIREIENLIKADLNCPQTSSLGRLFDGVTALTGLISTSEYEARGAIILQREAEKIEEVPDERYATSLQVCCDTKAIDYKNLIREIIRDLKEDKPVPLIAWKFHQWIADAIGSMLAHMERMPIILSGGCFQNILLTKMVTTMLEENDYVYYLNEKVPPNDGGISLGQAYY